ncbi:hypothetical protein LXM94_23840 [Rhizobium sp. TRM95111]|uniref:hypothetical protein n=1 Tax=Rhizobium alarense TaxID=2846851 RepID=UPI001F45DB76|nr:hypothetical protein [Rhizobium alarense]MCF3642999.1 hypothetical protein [Rhizobium alarense]
MPTQLSTPRRHFVHSKDIEMQNLHTLKNASGASPPDCDPILDAIARLQAGSAAFMRIPEADWPAHGGEEAVVEATYGPPHDALLEWREPIRSRAGAAAALRTMMEDHVSPTGGEGPSSLDEALLPLVLAFLEAEDGSMQAGAAKRRGSPARGETELLAAAAPAVSASRLINAVEMVTTLLRLLHMSLRADEWHDDHERKAMGDVAQRCIELLELGRKAGTMSQEGTDDAR